MPSGDRSANPVVFQGVAVSRERFSQSPPGNLVVLGGSLPLQMSLKQLDRPSPVGAPFQGTELAALSIPGQSRETGSLSRSPGGVGAPANSVPGSCLAALVLPV